MEPIKLPADQQETVKITKLVIVFDLTKLSKFEDRVNVLVTGQDS